MRFLCRHVPHCVLESAGSPAGDNGCAASGRGADEWHDLDSSGSVDIFDLRELLKLL